MESRVKFILKISFAAVLSVFAAVAITACSSDSDENGAPPPILFPETGAWSVPELIDTFDTGPSANPQIAADYNGNAIAVWHRFDGTYRNIWANHYTAYLGWGDAQLIENNDSTSYYPGIDIDNYGNAIVVWDDSENIWANRYEPDMGWNTPIAIGLNGYFAMPPDLSVNPSGDAIVVWDVGGGDSAGIWSNRYNIYEGWGNPEMIGIDHGGYGPSVAIDHFGNGIAVWTQWRHEPTTGKDVWANHYVAGTGWTGPMLISSGDSTEKDPKIAFDSVGNAMLVSRLSGWGCYDTWMFGNVCGSQSVILARQYTKEDGWGSAQGISSAIDKDPRQPQIAIDANGNAIAVWSQGAYLFGYHSQDAIYASRFTPESGWSISERIADYLAGSDSPQISFDSPGRVPG